MSVFRVPSLHITAVIEWILCVCGPVDAAGHCQQNFCKSLKSLLCAALQGAEGKDPAGDHGADQTAEAQQAV